MGLRIKPWLCCESPGAEQIQHIKQSDIKQAMKEHQPKCFSQQTSFNTLNTVKKKISKKGEDI